MTELMHFSNDRKYLWLLQVTQKELLRYLVFFLLQYRYNTLLNKKSTMAINRREHEDTNLE